MSGGGGQIKTFDPDRLLGRGMASLNGDGSSRQAEGPCQQPDYRTVGLAAFRWGGGSNLQSFAEWAGDLITTRARHDLEVELECTAVDPNTREPAHAGWGIMPPSPVSGSSSGAAGAEGV